MGILSNIEPKEVFHYFEELSMVPRSTFHTKKISDFCVEFAKAHNLEYIQDEVNNVIIKKPGTAGYENSDPVIIQGHLDMVATKTTDSDHDFENDPLDLFVDGDLIGAKNTTLGGDDGIAVAYAMAILASTDIPHPPIEAVFTVDEEIGMGGAHHLDTSVLKGKICLNIDSEIEGVMTVGCAGGYIYDTFIPIEWSEESGTKMTISLSNLQGGHSGDDINKGRGNAIKILNRFLWDLNERYGLLVASLEGGNLRNAIAREANAVIVFDEVLKENIRVDFNMYAAEMEEVWKITEPGLQLELESVDLPGEVLTQEFTNKLLNALYACPHGVFAMSYRMPGMVETSTNLAAVKFIENDTILITTSQRSDVDSEKMNIAHMVAAVFRLIGAEVEHGEGYPGWAPNPESAILKIAVESYKQLFGYEPVVRSIHAGLECGLFLEKYPGMDMISFGPTLRGVHSPDEKVDIETVGKWWKHLVDILERLTKEA